MRVVPKTWRRPIAEARTRARKRLSLPDLAPLDEMGRGPAEAAPCDPLVTLSAAYGRGGTRPEVVFFGDSTSVLTSPFDLSTKSLARMVVSALRPLHTCVVANLAYSTDVYAALLGALEVMPSQPKLVVVPVNVRQFGPEWSLNPNTQFSELLHAVDTFVEDPTRPIEVVPPFPRGNLLRGAPDADAWERFLATPVAYAGRPEGTVGDFVAAIERAPADEAERLEWFRMVFAFHFLYPLEGGNARLESLRAALRSAGAMGCKTLLYVMPANHEAGHALLGSAFDDAVAAKVEAVSRVVRESSSVREVELRDWTRLLPPDDFFFEYEVLSHINEFGRSRLANLIGEAVKQLHESALP